MTMPFSTHVHSHYEVAHTLGFDETVLRFIVLMQSALVIFGLCGMDEHRDGLLCDMTVDCLQRWTLEVGEKLRDLRLEVSLINTVTCRRIMDCFSLRTVPLIQ